MAEGLRTDWRRGWRAWRSVLVSRPEPEAEGMALIWGPRFDWAHASALLPQGQAQGRSLRAAADCFDALAPAQQQRVRGWMHQRLRHRNADNRAHATPFAD